MGVAVMILGESGSGKSTSLRNFEPDEIGIINVASKPLPFRKKMSVLNSSNYEEIKAKLRENKLRAYVIDDSQYLMAFESFAKAKVPGYGKFTEMAVNFQQLLDTATNDTSPDTIVYFLHHPETSDTGRVHAKANGKMLHSQLTIEGLFPIVLHAQFKGGSYVFTTQTDGCDTAKSPFEMFDKLEIPNDLKAVDTAIREYWNLKPLKGEQTK